MCKKIAIRRKCKFPGCERSVRENNKSGYCYTHYKYMYWRVVEKKKKKMGNEKVEKEVIEDFLKC